MKVINNFRYILTVLLLLFITSNIISQTLEKEKLLQFEEAITRGEEFLQAKDYARAKTEYQKALAIDPNAKYPKDKLVQIRKVYTDPQDELTFNNAVMKGDQFIEAGKYLEAKEQYASALLVKPDDRSAREKMANADKLLLEKDKKIAEYNKTIKLADSHYVTKDYHLALSNYKLAAELDNTNSYPLAKIDEIETLLAKEKALKDNYESILSLADEAYMNREFSLAKVRYEEASRLKPAENYPKSMLERVDNAIVEQVSNSAELEKQKAKELIEQRRLDSLKLENERIRLEELKRDEENQRLLALRELQIQDSIKTEQELRLAKEKRIEEEKQAAILTENIKQQRIVDSLRQQAATLAENIEKERVADSLKSAIDRQLVADNLAEQKRQKLITQEQLVQDKMADSLKAIEEANNAKNYEQERMENLAALQKAQADSLEASEQAQKLAVKKAEEAQIAEATRKEEEKKELEYEYKSQIDRSYSEAIEQANQLTTEQDYPSAIKAFERASELKPMEEYPKDRIIALNNYLLERLKNNLESYNKFIAAGDLAYQSNIFDKAIDEYEKALSARPEETYPSIMIDKIKKLMEDNAMINLVENATILIDANEQRFNFRPIDMRLRKNNYIVIKARKTSEKAPKVFINYGKDTQKSGGIVMRGIENDETSDYLLRISVQDSWYRVDNNWISIYPEGGDIEISEIQISQGDIEKIK